MDINKLTIEEKIGQMLILGIDTNHITNQIKEIIAKYKIGGVILYKKNFNTYKDMIELIQQLKEINKENKIPLFIGIDQEGGRVNRMPREILNLPSANRIAVKGGKEAVKDSGEIIGELLKKSGYNIDFAPVLDIKRFKDNHAIGDRCYGKNAEEVIRFGIPVMKELKKQGIIPVVKHFPGHGATSKDSHYFLPIIDKLKDEDMKPFEEAIKQGADAILIGHFLIKDITKRYPTSLSREFVTKYIRKRYRYNGLIITDDLKMKAIKFAYGTELAVKKAFQSGCDIIMLKYNTKEEKRIIDKMVNLVKNGRIKESRINKSVKRIIKIKEKYEVTNEQKIEGINIEEMNSKIEEIIERCNS